MLDVHDYNVLVGARQHVDTHHHYMNDMLSNYLTSARLRYEAQCRQPSNDSYKRNIDPLPQRGTSTSLTIDVQVLITRMTIDVDVPVLITRQFTTSMYHCRSRSIIGE